MIVKKILSILFYTTSLCAMEPKLFSVVILDTTINIRKESIFNADKHLDFLVVGLNQQSLLKQDNNPFSFNVGRIQYSHQKKLYEEEIHQPDQENLWSERKIYKMNKQLHSCENIAKVNSQRVACNVLKLTEPVILSFYSYQNEELQISYFIEIVDPRDNKSKVCDFGGKEALEIGSLHLGECYDYILSSDDTYNLSRFFQQLKSKPKKSIGFYPLGSGMGFSPKTTAHVAIKSILKFIRNNPREYSTIDFFMQKEVDFKKFKHSLNKYLGEVRKICLVLSAHTKKDGIFSLFPRDILYYIAHILDLIT